MDGSDTLMAEVVVATPVLVDPELDQGDRDVAVSTSQPPVSAAPPALTRSSGVSAGAGLTTTVVLAEVEPPALVAVRVTV